MSSLRVPSRDRTAGRRQRGNAVILALLGLLISALGAVGVIQGNRLRAKHEAGNGEATILDNLRTATNNAIFEGMGLIQSGAAISKSGVTVAPVDVGGELVWRPTVAQLVAMGYLPTGWTATTSMLNNAPYTIAFCIRFIKIRIVLIGGYASVGSIASNSSNSCPSLANRRRAVRSARSDRRAAPPRVRRCPRNP